MTLEYLAHTVKLEPFVVDIHKCPLTVLGTLSHSVLKSL